MRPIVIIDTVRRSCRKKNGQIKLRTVRRLEGITRFLFALSLPHSPLDHLILEQAAFQRSIKKRRTLGGGEADELRQPHVGTEQIGAPAREIGGASCREREE